MNPVDNLTGAGRTFEMFRQTDKQNTVDYNPHFFRSISLSAIAALLCTLIAACHPQKSIGADHDTRCEDFARTPVLFVHGSGLDSRSWSEMIKQFSRRGYPDGYLLAIDMLPNDGDNIFAAESFVRSGMEALLQTSGHAIQASDCSLDVPVKADLVAHSMGAFSSRWYAAYIQPERIRRLVTLAGANHGTNALCGRPGRGDRQMCPAFSNRAGAEDVQQQLNGTDAQPMDETPFGIGADSNTLLRIEPDSKRGITYYSIRLQHDRWIKPSASSMLDGSGAENEFSVPSLPVRRTSNGNYVFLAETSHDDLPSNLELIEFVYQLLSAGVPQ